MKCWKCGSQMMLDDGEPFCLTCGNRHTSTPVMGTEKVLPGGSHHRRPGKHLRADAGRKHNKKKEV